MFNIKNKTPFIVLEAYSKNNILNVLDVDESDIVFYGDGISYGVAIVYVGDSVKLKLESSRYKLCAQPGGTEINVVDKMEVPRSALPNILYYRDMGP